MIGGIFFLASIIAIFVVLNWFKDNDGRRDDQQTGGLLAMTPPEADPKQRGPRRWTREEALQKTGQGRR